MRLTDKPESRCIRTRERRFLAERIRGVLLPF
jgi:hypothetical protein